MKLRILTIATASVFAVSLAACAHDPAKLISSYTAAANDLDPDCGKKIHLELGQREMIGWPVPVPVITGTYDKLCKPEVFLDQATKDAIRQTVAEALEDFTAPR